MVSSLADTWMQRQRPCQAPDIEAVQHVDRDGTVSYILNNPGENQYLSLNDEGYFIWGLLNGERTLNEIAVAYTAHFHTFALGSIFAVIADLQTNGFLTESEAPLIPYMPDEHIARHQKILSSLIKALTWRVELHHLDRTLDILNRTVGRALYAPVTLVLYALVFLAGLGAFIDLTLTHTINTTSAQDFFVPLTVGYVIATLLHEVGHGLTVKRMGRRVIGGGFGWMVFAPFFYINTSDMWLATKWRRLAVTAGGPIVTFLLASGAALAALIVHTSPLAAPLLTFASVNFVMMLFNLCPGMPTDGYFFLMDLVEIPALREKAMLFLGRGEFVTCLRTRSWTREQRVFAWFGAFVLLYTLFTLVQMGFIFAEYAAAPLQHLLPDTEATIGAWVIGLLIGALFSLPMIREMRTGQQTIGGG